MVNIAKNQDGEMPVRDSFYTNWKKKTGLFFAGQTVTLIGSMLVQYAIIWYITWSYKSGVMVMLATLFGFLPQVIVSLFAGVWADRFSKKALIILSDLGIAAVTLVVAVLFWLGINNVWILLAVAAVRSVGQGIQTPAVNAFVADIVPKDKLLKVNGFMGSLNGAVSIIPIMLGAVLVTATAAASSGLSPSFMPIIFMIDVATALVGIGILLFIKGRKSCGEKEKTGYITELKEGARYVLSNKFLKTYFVFYALLNFLIIPVAFLSPLQVARSYGAQLWRLPAVELAFAIGMIAAGILIGFLPGFKSRTKTVAAASVAGGGLIALLGAVPFIPFPLEIGFILYLTVMFFNGCSVPYYNAPSITVLQETADPKMMGRVFGFVQIATALALPAGMLLFGPLSDAVDIEWLLLATGIVMAIVGVVLFRNKTIQNYKSYAYKPPEDLPEEPETEIE